MFTGIIEGFGKIVNMGTSSMGYEMSIISTFRLDDFSIGDSIAVDGVCLTATKIKDSKFTVDVSPETLKKTTLNNVKTGILVNLERSLKLSDRIDGHIVSGHIDGVGHITHRKNEGNATILSLSIPETLSSHIISKGSIAIDGISLTVNSCSSTSLEVSIIPHTLKKTTLNKKKQGDKVNIETDIISKYVSQFFKKNIRTTNTNNNIDIAFLVKNGFA